MMQAIKQSWLPKKAVLDPPTNLRDTDKYLDSLTIAWDGVPEATSYNIYDSNGVLLQAGVSGTSFTFTGLELATYYYFHVTSATSTLESVPSEVLSVKTDFWKRVASTRSKNAAWAFDRLRLYNPTNRTRVAIFKNSTGFTPETGEMTNGELVEAQQFSSTNSFEHDFTFDLSWNTGSDMLVFAIAGIPEGAKFSQVYAYPTGYSATRGKNAEIYSWNFNLINPVVGADTSGNAYVRLNNQSLNNVYAPGVITANSIILTNNSFTSGEVDTLLEWVDNNGLSNGTLDYSGSFQDPTSASRVFYDSLIAKNWNIIGTPPPTI